MTLLEFDCQESKAIERIIYNDKKYQLIVKYRYNPRIYCYNNVHDNIIKLLKSKSTSKGLLVSTIKKLTDYRIIDKFPIDNNIKIYDYDINISNNNNNSHDKIKKKRKKIYSNYSLEWLNLLSKQPDYLEFESLLPILESLHPKYPPNKPPTIDNNDIDNISILSISSLSQSSKNSLQSIKTQVSQSSLLNPFSSLQDSDDDDDDDSINNSDDNLTIERNVNDDNISIQSRYLIVRIKSFICDCIRKEAIDLERTNEASIYIKIAALWQLAFLKLNELIISTDEWWAILIERKLNLHHSNILKDKHNYKDLNELHEGLLILKEDTIMEKNRTLYRLSIILQRIKEKLDPMLSERNTVKKSYGIFKWTHNKEPKLDFVEKRAKLEQDFKELTKCMTILNDLELES